MLVDLHESQFSSLSAAIYRWHYEVTISRFTFHSRLPSFDTT